MSGIKTAISLEENLFNKVNALANEMHVSRSKLFTLAVKEFLKKQENNKLLAQLNEAYGDSPSEEETGISNAMHEKQRLIAEQDSWQ